MLKKIDNLIEGLIVKRPSKHIKSPYVADVIIEDEEVLAHSACLGCCGLSDKDASILMAPMKNENNKCKYSIYLSVYKEIKNKNEIEIIVGIQPKLAESLAENALNKNFLSTLQNVKSYKREKVYKLETPLGNVDSRFDFAGIDADNIPFIMEVKNVPLADYEDLPEKERKKRDFSEREFNTKVAYFPDGYRKKKTDTVSPRALKHIQELTIICKQETKTRCIMCYVIQRNDVNRFTASIIDEQYRQAVKDAMKAGVEIITMVVEWNKEGIATFIRDDLPITFSD
jgi:DNA-binding sugar fermentation-stimulating protein